jgi:hypothetical protein
MERRVDSVDDGCGGLAQRELLLSAQPGRDRRQVDTRSNFRWLSRRCRPRQLTARPLRRAALWPSDGLPAHQCLARTGRMGCTRSNGSRSWGEGGGRSLNKVYHLGEVR